MPEYDNKFLKSVKAKGRQIVTSALDTSAFNNLIDYSEVKLAVMQAKSGKTVSVDEILRNAVSLMFD